MIKQLPPKDLRWQFNDFKRIQSILSQRRSKKNGRIGAVPQTRAIKALELGLGIKQRGYNIFVVGLPGTGRTSTVEKLLTEEAAKENTPNDVVLLYNFSDRDRPHSVLLPASYGPKLKKSYDTLIHKVLSSLEKAFESDQHILLKQIIQNDCRENTDEALKEIEEEASKNSFVLSHSGASLTLTPARDNGEALTEEDFEKLTETEKIKLEQRAEKLEIKLEESMKKVRAAEKESEDAIEELEKDTAKKAIASIFEAIRQTWKQHKTITNHLSAIEEDILLRLKRFIHDDKTQENNEGEPPAIKRKTIEDEDEDLDEPLFIRYKVNILVTHAKDAGAPIVFETHPTASNIIGRIEQKIRSGETATDFTKIKAGALYKSNGGFLVLEAMELLRDPGAWEGLKRALKNKEIELDDPGEPGRMVSLASLRPEPVPLNLKIILIGAPEIYYALARNDLDFQSLFKVKADFDIEIDRSNENIDKYAHFLHSLCSKESLSKISPEGFGSIIEQAVRLSGNKKKMTCNIGEIADLLREANYWAKKDRSKLIDASHVITALKAKGEREGFVETQILEEIISNKLVIDITGQKIGQTNALTVVEAGNYEFGTPIRVTCQIGCGKGEIIDIERETEQGGPFHSKGRLIIRGLLSNLFGSIMPFSFHATLCMEQTYSEIDGDSASMAEACALLSSLSSTPIFQCFAMTGAIDQMGNVQAVGGINEKIEGFYKVCCSKNITDQCGVIIPAQNIDDTMLSQEVIQAVKKGKFQVISVDKVTEAMKVLTGVDWDGSRNSLQQRCLTQLTKFNNLRDFYHSHDRVVKKNLIENKNELEDYLVE